MNLYLYPLLFHNKSFECAHVEQNQVYFVILNQCNTATSNVYHLQFVLISSNLHNFDEQLVRPKYDPMNVKLRRDFNATFQRRIIL